MYNNTFYHEYFVYIIFDISIGTMFLVLHCIPVEDLNTIIDTDYILIN